MMGFMDAEYIENADTEKKIGLQHHQMGVWIGSRYPPMLAVDGDDEDNYFYGPQTRSPQQVEFKIGDRVRLEFDLKWRQCSVLLNDRQLGNVFYELPDTFYLAVSVYYEQNVYETTLFEVV